MNDGWNSDGESQTNYTPIYSKTFARGGNRRNTPTGRYYGNQQGERNDYTFGVKDNGQAIQGGRFDHNRRQNQDGGNWQENPPGGRNDRGVRYSNRTEVVIKACDVGKIIGKGGTKIRELQTESHARIQVCNH
jgi:hypothetical protein